jgi:hypothetical protein
VIADGALVNFATAQQTTASTSSTETEFMSTIDACNESSYPRNSLPGLITVVIPIEASLDNIGAGYVVQNCFSNSRTTHIDVKSHMIRDGIAKKSFELFHIETFADILVKALAAPEHRGLAHHLPGNFLPIKASLGSIGAGCIVQNYVSNSRTKHTDVEFHTHGSRLDRQGGLQAVPHREQRELCQHPRQGTDSTCSSWTGSSSLWWSSSDVKFHTNRGWITKGDFKSFHIKSIGNSANILAKAPTAPAHHGLAHSLSLVDFFLPSLRDFFTPGTARTLPTSSPKHRLRLHIADWLIVLLMDFHSPRHQSGVCERNLY